MTVCFSQVYYDWESYYFKGVHFHRYTGKCHHLIIKKDITKESVEVFNKILHDTAKQNRLDIKIDKHFNFKIHQKDSKVSKSEVKWS